MTNLFLKEMPVAIILILRQEDKPQYAYQVARKTGCAVSHACKVIYVLRDLGLVELAKKGNKKFITLTDKGKEVSENIRQIKNVNQMLPWRRV